MGLKNEVSAQWFGAHPLEGSVSMGVYRDALLRSIRKGDPYEIRSWPKEGTPTRSGPRWQRFLGKYLSYPGRIALQRESELVHFLDHSSAHLIPYVPKGKKIVATLHDLIPLRYQDQLTQSQVARFRCNVDHLKRCDAVVAVSEYSKAEAIDLLGLKEAKITVVPNGVDPGPVPQKLTEAVQLLRERGATVIVLSVGSTIGRKNLAVLPELFELAQKNTGQNIALLRVGAALSNELRSNIESSLGRGMLLEAGRLSEQDLWACYHGCDLVIVPSLYEGFGLPVLEGLSCGKPVVSSNSSSLPEVGGNYAEYFNPTDPSEGAVALIRAMMQRGDVALAERRTAYARDFTWRRHLEALYSVYDRILT